MVQNLASTSGVLKAEFSFRRFFGLLKEYKIGEKGYVLEDGNRYMANFAWIHDYRVGVVSFHPMAEFGAIVAETRKGVLALMGLVLLATLGGRWCWASGWCAR